MVSGRSVKCNAIFAVYDLSALGVETLLFGMFSRVGYTVILRISKKNIFHC